MKTFGAAKCKEQCLALIGCFDAVRPVTTKRGKQVARVLPFGHQHADLLDRRRGKIELHGDLLTIGIGWGANAQS